MHGPTLPAAGSSSRLNQHTRTDTANTAGRAVRRCTTLGVYKPPLAKRALAAARVRRLVLAKASTPHFLPMACHPTRHPTHHPTPTPNPPFPRPCLGLPEQLSR